MSTEIEFGGPQEDVEQEVAHPPVSPDEFFANSAFRMVYQTNNFFLPQIHDLIVKREILNLRPEYQRRLRWTRPQKSRLIESLLLNIPVPPIFLYESTEARYEVMDGQQRLNAVTDFIAGDFALHGLPVLTPLNGLRYTRFSPRIKRALNRASLSAIVLLLESEPEKQRAGVLTLTDIRRFIFDRLNTGGTKLNSQEIRNALNPGVFNDTLINLTRLPIFTRIFDIPPYEEADPNEYYENRERKKNRLYAQMEDCQLVLRYFALRDKSNIRGSMKSMLDRAMEVEITREQGEEWNREYCERINFLDDLFDHAPFRLPPNKTGRRRLSAAFYDASMVAINDLWKKRETIKAEKPVIPLRLKAAMEDEEKFAILTGKKNTASAVRERIRMMRQILLP